MMALQIFRNAVSFRTVLFVLLALDLFGCNSPLREVFTNYNERKKEIDKAIEYFSDIKPADLELPDK